MIFRLNAKIESNIIMEEEQMSECQELQILDIFNEQVIESTNGAKQIYNPLFSKIRIFGTPEAPIFVAKDVQDVLNIKDLNYKREDSHFEWGEDKVKIKVKTNAGMRDMIAFTEQGLYNAIWMSKMDVAKQFKRFMTCVMTRLRMTGVVTMDDAVADYKEKIAQMEKRDKALNMQMEIEHRDLLKLRARDEVREITINEQSSALYKANMRLENSKDPNINELKDRLTRLLERTGRSVIVMLAEAPKEHKDSHNYELTDYSEWDEEFTDSSAIMIYSLGLTTLKSKVPIKRVYVHKTIKLDDIHLALNRYRLEKQNGYYANNYEISLDHIDIIIDDLNKADEAKHVEN